MPLMLIQFLMHLLKEKFVILIFHQILHSVGLVDHKE